MTSLKRRLAALESKPKPPRLAAAYVVTKGNPVGRLVVVRVADIKGVK